MKPIVDIVVTGTANLASVRAAFERLGCEPKLLESQKQLEQSERLLLPGVGTLAAAKKRLQDDGLWQPLGERLAAGRPTLAICLGLQLLAAQSEESPGIAGFGLHSVPARRFEANVRVPHIGWNRVEGDGEWLPSGFAYFANSFGLREEPGADWQTCWTEHGVKFVSAMRRGNIWAMQFHPELSGKWGQGVLESWLASCGGRTSEGDA
jgi:glutamine amidotransferase